MGKRLVMGLVAVVAVIALGGIGFAAFSASATINGSATAGTFGLVWAADNGNTPTQIDNSQCFAGTVSGSAWTGVAGATFAPGDGCIFTDGLTNTGNLPGTLVETLTVSDTNVACGLQYWSYADTLVGSQTFTAIQANGPVTVTGSPIPIGASTTIPFTGEFSLSSGAPNGCQGDSLSISVTITGTAS